MDPKALEKTIRRTLNEGWTDEQLRSKLEALAETEQNFRGFTWLWGPELYRRNRLLFRPFILGRFGQLIRTGKTRWEFVKWKGAVATALEDWLTEIDARDDIELFKRLYEWKLSALGQGIVKDVRQKAILPDLLRRFRGAATRAAREIVLQKFSLWFELDESTALELYRLDPITAGPFILRHLPWSWMENKRAFWQELLRAARAKKDDAFAWDLYRRQVPRETWKTDVLSLAGTVRDPVELVRQLDLHHPSGWGRTEGGVYAELLQRRGRDVMPYIVRNLRAVRHGWFTGGEYRKLLDLARDKGWWDLWAAIVRVCATAKEFNREVEWLLRQAERAPEIVRQRLAGLAGVSREFNFPGLGFAAVHQLEEDVALMMLQRFPDLLRGPYLQHLQASPWQGSYSNLIEKLLTLGEDDLLDHLAARIATRTTNRWNPKSKDTLAEAERLATFYDALKDRDEVQFSRRAASVLSRIPAYSIHRYHQLIGDNRLARLLFARSASAYLADARSVRDLVEGSEIHVQALAYRVLSLDDDRARALAAENIALLLGTLLRPLHRATRSLAFGALANAATTGENAARVLAKAREALDLPDEKYPKEALLGLIARIIARWPALRGPREDPVVYRRSAA